MNATSGALHVALACADQADLLAAAYVSDQPLPSITTLASKDMRGKSTLRIRHASCPVAVIVQALDPNARDGAFDWQRPLAETARSTGGPIIACAAPSKIEDAKSATNQGSNPR